MDNLDDFNLEKLLQRSGLNEDCLVHILKYLNVCELMSVCDLDTETDKSFTNLINNRVIKRKLFHFGKIQSQRTWPVVKVFENFGHSMKRLKVVIAPHTFNHFLRKVIKYCQVDNLLELEIVFETIDTKPGKEIPWNENFDDPRLVLDIETELRAQIQPFFRQLNQLTLRALKNTRLNPTFFCQINLPNPTKTKIVNIFTNKHWADIFPQQICTNITKLDLMNFELHESIGDFENFLQRIPNLEVFIHPKGKLGLLPVAEKLIERFPNLRCFGYNDSVEYNLDGRAIDDHFKIFSRFTNLTQFHLRGIGYRNLHKILQFLPHIKVLSIWQVEINHRAPVETQRIVQSIRSIISARRAHAPANDRIHLHVDQQQYNDFKAIQNTDDILHMTIVNHRFF